MEIEVIEAKQKEKKKLRVCAYCRVSTDEDEQANSLENQISYFRNKIRNNPDILQNVV